MFCLQATNNRPPSDEGRFKKKEGEEGKKKKQKKRKKENKDTHQVKK